MFYPPRRHNLSVNLRLCLCAFLCATLASVVNANGKQGIAVLCYHDLQLKPINDMVNTPSNFEAHLKWLKEHGYRTIGVEDLVLQMKGREPMSPKEIVLTFDDGYEGVYRYAYPLLKKFGFKATLFLVTSVMGNEKGSMPHLTWPQIAEMDKAGVIEADVHACKLHVKLGKLAAKGDKEAKAVVSDLAHAQLDIKEHVGHLPHYIAWPYGDYNKNLIAYASALGFYGMLNTEYGINRKGDSVAKIKRLRMSSGYDNLKRFAKKLAQYGLT